MKLLVVGSPTIKEFDFSTYVTPETDTIICDGEKGVAALAEQYADSNRLSKYVVRPLRDIRGRALLTMRNEAMVDMADAVLFIWDGHTKGIEKTLFYAKRTNKPYAFIIV
jgi:hypothetical protein